MMADPAQQAATWIAADWGTSNLRLWPMTTDDTALAERRSDRGMGRLAPGEYEAALLDLAQPFLAPGRVTEVIVCGMAGARQGWAEAPYLPVPCRPDGRGAVTAPTRDPRLHVRILPGLSQASPPDVMRGEETQIAGFLSEDPAFRGTLCLPGTHSKWVRIAGGRVEGFRTAMTGELFALLAHSSMLCHATGPGWQDEAFRDAVRHTAARPEGLTTALFAIRARDLLEGPAPGAARARLSGLLIGAELAATRDFWQSRPVVVIGAAELSAHYIAALCTLGVEAKARTGEGLVLAGLAQARQAMKGEST